MPLEEDIKLDSGGKDVLPVKFEKVDLSLATVAETVALDVPPLMNHKRAENANGEAEITATFGEEIIQQTLPISGTGLLLFDPNSMNHVFVPVDIPDGLQFVELLRGVRK